MRSFWEGFEKKAVSLKWLQEKYLRGLARRAGEDPTGGFTKKIIDSDLTGFDAMEQWRKMDHGGIFKKVTNKDVLDRVSEINKRTKGKKGNTGAIREWAKEVREIMGKSNME